MTADATRTTTTTREQIVAMVRDRPGMNATALARAAQLDDTTVSYHLRRLARDGRVASESSGRELVWFAQEPGCSFCPVLRRAIPLLRRDAPRALAYVIGPEPRSIRGLARAADLHPGSARRAAVSMEELGIVVRSPYGRAFVREGGDVCVSKALAADACAAWGACPVSKAWAARQNASAGRR